MLKSILKITALGALALAIAGSPVQTLAQTTNKTSSTKKSTTEKKDTTKSEKKSAGHPFHGNLAAVDKVAKSITLGKSTYLINSETKITKAGKPATLDDGVVGEEVGGYAKANDAGKMVATSVRFGPKVEGTTTDTKQTKTAKTPK